MKYRVFTYDINRKEWEVEADSEEEAEAIFQFGEPLENDSEVVVIDDYFDGVEVEFVEEVREYD